MKPFSVNLMKVAVMSRKIDVVLKFINIGDIMDTNSQNALNQDQTGDDFEIFEIDVIQRPTLQHDQ